MKNKYEILGVNQNATKDEINKAYTGAFNEYKSKESVTPSEKAEMVEKSRAYKTSMDDEARANYDDLIGVIHAEDVEFEPTDLSGVKDLDVKQEKGWFAKHKSKLITGALIVAVGISAFAIGRSSSKNNDKDNATTPIVSTSVDSNDTPKPTTIPSTPVPTAEVKQPVERIALTAENFEEQLNTIKNELNTKGLNVLDEIIVSTLRVVNQNDFTAEDVVTLFGEDYDIMKDVENTLAMASMIITHNNQNDLDKQISFAQFINNDFDYEMLGAFDEMALDLATYARSGDTSKKVEVNQIIKDVEAFHISNGTIEISTGKYSKPNLSPAAQFISEFSSIQMTNEVNEFTNALVSDEVEKLVQSEIELEDVSDELNQLRVNLELVLSSPERMVELRTALDEANESFTEEQKMEIDTLINLINSEIAIQNIQNNCNGLTCLPHIINFDFAGCFENNDMTR